MRRRRRSTLSQVLLEEDRRSPGLGSLLSDLVSALQAIAARLAKAGPPRKEPGPDALDLHGEAPNPLDRLAPNPLDLLAHRLIVEACERNPRLAGLTSEEIAGVHPLPARAARGDYLLAFDPLDGSSNTEINVTLGTVFSVLRRPGGAGRATAEDFLQPGTQQICAGYALYGPATMLVITFGRGVRGFTLDRARNEFLLTHPEMKVPEPAHELCIDPADERFWEPPVRRYVAECLSGKRGREFASRWVGAMVVDVHRVLIRGGVYLHPKDSKRPARSGRLRLLYEIDPLAILVEQAGGAATTGHERVLTLVPRTLQERAPVILGSREEVERVVRYHHAHRSGTDEPYRSPLFGERSLFTRP